MSLSSVMLQSQDSTAETGKGSSVKVTGCLKKGTEPGGFTLAGDDGKLWELMGSSANLSRHVGHTVTVSGHAVHKTALQETKMEKNEKQEANGKQLGDLKVSSVKMVSDSCQ